MKDEGPSSFSFHSSSSFQGFRERGRMAQFYFLKQALTKPSPYGRGYS